MTAYSGVRPVLLAGAMLAGVTFASADKAFAQAGGIICRYGSTQYRHCCSQSFREHPRLRGRARGEDINDCMSGSSAKRRDREDREGKRAKERTREDQEETKSKNPPEEREKSSDKSTSQSADCSGPETGKAGVYSCGKFAVWLPADWKVKMNRGQLVAQGNDLTAVVGYLDDIHLKDKEVTDFIDDELDGTKLTSDQNGKRDDANVRSMEGTAEDVAFRALALGLDNGAIEALVYGEPKVMQQNQDAVERILNSINPP